MSRLSAKNAMLDECAAQFRFYAEQHRAKNTDTSTAKATVNEGFAARCATVRAL